MLSTIISNRETVRLMNIYKYGKYLLLINILFFIVSCGGSNGTDSDSTPTPTSTSTSTSDSTPTPTPTSDSNTSLENENINVFVPGLTVDAVDAGSCLVFWREMYYTDVGQSLSNYHVYITNHCNVTVAYSMCIVGGARTTDCGYRQPGTIGAKQTWRLPSDNNNGIIVAYWTGCTFGPSGKTVTASFGSLPSTANIRNSNGKCRNISGSLDFVPAMVHWGMADHQNGFPGTDSTIGPNGPNSYPLTNNGNTNVGTNVSPNNNSNTSSNAITSLDISHVCFENFRYQYTLHGEPVEIRRETESSNGDVVTKEMHWYPEKEMIIYYRYPQSHTWCNQWSENGSW